MDFIPSSSNRPKQNRYLSRSVNLLIASGAVILALAVWHEITGREQETSAKEVTIERSPTLGLGREQSHAAQEKRHELNRELQVAAGHVTLNEGEEVGIGEELGIKREQVDLLARARVELEEMLLKRDLELATLRGQLQEGGKGNWKEAMEQHERLQEAYTLLQLQHTALTERLEEVTSELEQLRVRVDHQLATQSEIATLTERDAKMRERLAKATQTGDELREQLERSIISRAHDEVELQLHRERLGDLERALAVESSYRGELEQAAASLGQTLSESLGVEPVPHAQGIIAQAGRLLHEKEFLLRRQQGELTALLQAHEALQRQFSAISDIAEERASALMAQMERIGSMEEVLRAERRDRLEIEKGLAARNEQRQLLTQLERTQQELTERIQGLSQTSEVLQQEKYHLERKVQELVAAGQQRERSLQMVRQQSDALLSEQSELEHAFGQLNTENCKLMERVAQLERIEEQVDLERARRMRGETLYNQLAASLREQQQILSQMEESRNELRRELEQLRREQPRLVEGRKGGLSEIPEMSFDKPVRRAPVVVAPQPPKPAASTVYGVEETTRLHLVRAGETLSQISQRYYGTANRWSQIFEANRDLISDVNKIPVGTRLVIP